MKITDALAKIFSFLLGGEFSAIAIYNGLSSNLIPLRKGDEHSISEYEKTIVHEGIPPDLKGLPGRDLVPRFGGQTVALKVVIA